jgi:hypothetical protein
MKSLVTSITIAVLFVFGMSAIGNSQSANPSKPKVRWTPLVGQPIGLNTVVGLAARKTLIGLARPLQLFNYLMY